MQYSSDNWGKENNLNLIWWLKSRNLQNHQLFYLGFLPMPLVVAWVNRWTFYPRSPEVEPWIFRWTFSSPSPSYPSPHHQLWGLGGTVLYCTVYCTVLYCIVLYFTVLYCIVLYCTILYCTVLYCSVLYCTVLYCTVKKNNPTPQKKITPTPPPKKK